jgi:heme-degrading monooxygenase HmoA
MLGTSFWDSGCLKTKGAGLKYAALIEVDNSREDPESGLRGLREELAPTLKAMPGFDSALLLTAYDHGRGVAVIVFESEDAARAVASSFAEGQEIRDGVVITRQDVLEVSASA